MTTPAIDITTRDRIAADALRWAADRIDPGPRNNQPTPADETHSITMCANRGTATNLRFWADQVERGYIEPRPAGSQPHTATNTAGQVVAFAGDPKILAMLADACDPRPGTIGDFARALAAKVSSDEAQP